VINYLIKLRVGKKNCFNCLNDDFNTPMLIAEIFNASKLINQIEKSKDFGKREKEYFLNLFDNLLDKILGIDYSKPSADNDSVLEILLNIRDNARQNKDFELSDSIRNQLNNLGIIVSDKN
jgi:cysteinyl-tRNA synthetase